MCLALVLSFFAQTLWAADAFQTSTVSFPSGSLQLRGTIYKPKGDGPFPAVVYNHGSPKETAMVAKAVGPIYAKRGWVFFMPDRRGHGLSANVGPYIMDETDKASKRGKNAGAMALIRLLTIDHLDDQIAAADWLRKQKYVHPKRVAVHGHSFGGILTILGAERGNYCAGIDAAGGAMNWNESQDLQQTMMAAASRAKSPIFFLQADNDYTTIPSRVLSNVMRKYQKPFQLKMYPPVGKTHADAHNFAYTGGATWAEDIFKFLDKYCIQEAQRTEADL